MPSLQDELMNSLSSYETGRELEISRNEKGEAVIGPSQEAVMRITKLRAPMRQREKQTKEQTAKEFGPALAGVATGPAVGAAEVVDLGLGLVKGAYKAAFPDADEGRFESFMQTLGDQFESGYGEGARSIILDIGKRAGYDEEQLKVMDEGITAGSFFGYGGAIKAAPKAVSALGDAVEGAGDAAKARMADADGSVTLTSGVDPDPAIAALGDAVKAMRGNDEQFLSLLEKDVRLEYPDVDLDIYGDSQKGYTLSKIIVPKEKRKQGIGEQVMGRIVATADQEGAVVKLTPSKDFGATSTARLKKFYKKFGFVENKGRYKDFSIKETMYRLPVAKEINASLKPPTEKQPGIIAFHGSGADFDEFQVKYIGTGEGAQAYGYGLYFTESEDIAKFYRDTVANQENIYLQLNGKPIDSVYTQDNIDAHSDFLERNFEPDEYDDALIVLDNLGQGLNTIDDADAMAESSLNLKQFSIYEKIRESLKEPELAEGKMYKVSIEPKPEDMIDYQTTFADQPKKIQDALKAVGYEVETNKVGMKVSPSEIRDAMRMPMSVIIDRLKKQMGPKELSQKLLEQGVPGIKYRAAGSRGANVDAADAKMNYVVFDDKMIKILEKYGIVGPVAITGVAASQQEGKSDGTGA